MARPDVVIAGAGIIGLSCALELHHRGLSVTVLERGHAGREASWAAAGMLAAHDPANPPELQPIADLSISLYPGYLANIWTLSDIRVPLETYTVYEQDDVYPVPLPATSFSAIQGKLLASREDSLDPRKLMQALLAAVRASTIELREEVELRHLLPGEVLTSAGPIACSNFIDCRGAWAGKPLRPMKGQMLRVHAPGVLTSVVRTGDIYMVPRLDGSILIGATVEDVGFNKTIHASDLAQLRARAAALVPELAHAPMLESWAGLRPDTPDHLPLIGKTNNRCYIAAGHYRNGILLAPATAHVMTQLVQGNAPSIDLAPFSPNRFGR